MVQQLSVSTRASSEGGRAQELCLAGLLVLGPLTQVPRSAGSGLAGLLGLSPAPGLADPGGHLAPVRVTQQSRRAEGW